MHVHVLIAPEEVDELLANLSGSQGGVHVQQTEEQEEEEEEEMRLKETVQLVQPVHHQVKLPVFLSCDKVTELALPAGVGGA